MLARLKQRIPQLCLILTLGALFGPTLARALREWTRHPASSHGLAVALVVIWLTAICWPRVVRTRPHPHWAGFLILAAAVGLRAFTPSSFSLHPSALPLALLSAIIAAGGLVVALRGWVALRELLAPYLLSFGMLPSPEFFYRAVAPHLQVPVAIGATALLKMGGITAIRDGTDLAVRGGVFVVGPACSGIHSLLALVLVAAVVAAIAQGALWRRLLLPVLALIVAPVINVARVAAVVGLAAWRGDFQSVGRVHQASGFAAFCLAGVILWVAFRWLGLTLSRSKDQESAVRGQARGLPSATRYLLAAAIALAGAVVMYLRASR